jgi:hypothetical protein
LLAEPVEHRRDFLGVAARDAGMRRAVEELLPHLRERHRVLCRAAGVLHQTLDAAAVLQRHHEARRIIAAVHVGELRIDGDLDHAGQFLDARVRDRSRLEGRKFRHAVRQ